MEGKVNRFTITFRDFNVSFLLINREEIKKAFTLENGGAQSKNIMLRERNQSQSTIIVGV